jgi:hypothetical protein
MENKTKTALFVGGFADGWTKEIVEIQPRLQWSNTTYILRGDLETKSLGAVYVYVSEAMNGEEENSRMEIIKKSL